MSPPPKDARAACSALSCRLTFPNIALDASYSVGDSLTGVGRYSVEILSGLCRAHPDHRFRFCYRPHRYIRSLRTPLPPNADRSILFERWPLRRFDLFHGLNQRLPAAGYKRAIATFHDLFVLSGDYSTAEFRARFAQQARNAARRADLVIAVSAFTAAQVTEFLGVEQSRIRIIHHGVRPPVPPAGKRERIVLHVGAVQKRKNIANLVRAFEQSCPGWKLVLAGSLGHGGTEIVEQIRSSVRAGDIELLGYVTAARLEELYGQASIFAFPSLDEGFGIPVLEAMAHGIPVITSNRSALPEVAGDAALLVNPHDVADLAGALESLTRDEGLRTAFGQRGIQQASLFTWETAIARTWNVYNEAFS